MYCKNCGKEISESAKFCDGCGKPIAEDSTAVVEKKSKKKKKKHPILGTIIVIFGVLLIIGSMGGNSEPEKVGSAPSESISTEEAQQSDFTVGDKVELNDIVVTLVDVTESNGGNFMTPESGKVFVLCEFEIENNSSKDITISSLMCFEAYIDDYSTSLDLSATVSANKGQLDGTIAAGKKMSGVIGYSADEDWSTLEVRFTPDFWAGKDIIFVYSK